MIQCKVDMNQENIMSTFASTRIYGDEEVFLRELLQNAMDACNTRSALEWSFGTEFLELEEARAINSMREPFQARISISYTSMTQRLVVEDNGIGINAEDIEKYVAKVGCSYYTSEAFAQQQLHYEPIGQFGVGMLSCFMVARGILIESKKDKSINTAWNVSNPQSLEPITAKWIENEETIEYITSKRAQSGTKITLVLHPKYAMRISLQGMVSAVMHYMLYQPFPIEISYDEQRVVLQEPNRITDNPFADVLGIVSIPILDELMEGCIWIYNSKQENMIGKSVLYQQGFLISDGTKELPIKPEWLRHMTYRLNIRKNFLTLRLSRDGVAEDGKLKELRALIGQRIVQYFSKNPLGLNQYLSSGRQPVLTEYEEEMQLLGEAVSVEVFLKGREIELPIETIIRGFAGKVIRIAFISKDLFNYYRLNYFSDFRRFQKENRLIVFEKNRDIFCQMLAPYRKSQRYVISEYPGIIYDDMVADFQEIKSVVTYRHAYRLRPAKIGYEEIFCLVTNEQNGRLELLVNEEHYLAKMLAPVRYHPKVHNMMEVIYENIKQRIINTNHHWNKVVNFGGSFVDDWDPKNIATVQSVGCLERDFTESVNEYIETRLSERDRVELGLVGFQFHREDFISWWYMPRE